MSLKPFLPLLGKKPELRPEVECVIMDGAEQTKQRYFSSTFINDGGYATPLHYPANNRKQHFVNSAEDVRTQLTHLNTYKSECSDEKSSPVLHTFWLRYWQKVTIIY